VAVAVPIKAEIIPASVAIKFFSDEMLLPKANKNHL
jgi:hypothetical protein